MDKHQYRTAIDKLARMLDANQKARDQCVKYDEMLIIKENEYKTSVNRLKNKRKEISKINEQISGLNKKHSDIMISIKISNQELDNIERDIIDRKIYYDNLNKSLYKKEQDINEKLSNIISELSNQKRIQQDFKNKTSELTIKHRTLSHKCDNEISKFEEIRHKKEEIINEIEKLEKFKKELDNEINNLSVKYITNGTI